MTTNAYAQLGSKGASVNASKSNYNTFAPIHSAIDQFRQAIKAAGIHYSGEIIPDDKLHRFHIAGHKQGSKSGAHILHADKHRAGYFQDFKTGFSQTWRNSSGARVSYALIKQIKEVKLQHEAEIHQKHAEAAKKASYIWSQSKPIVRSGKRIIST